MRTIVGRRGRAAVKIPVSVKLAMRLTNVFALVARFARAYGAQGVVLLQPLLRAGRGCRADDLRRRVRLTAKPSELRNVLRTTAICVGRAAAVWTFAVSTGVHDGEAAVKALLCGAAAVRGLHGDPPEGIRSRLPK